MTEIMKIKFLDPKIKNADGKTALELSSTYGDYDATSLIYEFILQRKKRKLKDNIKRISEFLKDIIDFSIEMKWEVNVPLFSFLCPKDTCKIWKVQDNVRLDYSFVQYKHLMNKRSPMSFLFYGKGRKKDFYLINWKQEEYFNPYEPLGDYEKAMILKEIMNNNRLITDFKLNDCEIKESKSFTNKPVYETINNVRTQKFEISISTCLNIQNKEIVSYLNLDPISYFDPEESLNKKIDLIYNEKELKQRMMSNLHVKNENMRKQIFKLENKKVKSFKAYMWIAEDYPIGFPVLERLLSSFSSANEFTGKLKEFLKNETIQNIIRKKGFPVKIRIPVNFFIDITVSFGKFHQIQETNETISSIFGISPNFHQVSRWRVENLKDNYKKRLAYANMV